MTAWTDSSETVQDLAFMVLDHAMDSLAGGSPLLPFAVTETAGKRGLQRVASGSLEEMLAKCRAFLVTQTGVDAAALAYDGYLTLDGVRTDAVYIEAQAPGMTAAACLHQRYVPVPDGSGPDVAPELIGNPADSGDRESILPVSGSPPGSKKRFGRRG